MSDDVSLKKIFVISLLLHLLLLLIPLRVVVRDTAEAMANELKDKAEKKLTFVFVETPENARESPVEQVTPFISDKNLAASNPQAPENLPMGMPYQQGRSEVPEMLPQQTPPTATPGSPNEMTRQQQQQQRQEGERQPKNQEQQKQNESADAASLDALRQLEALSRLTPPKQEQQALTPAPQLPPGESSPPSAPSAPRYNNRGERAPVGADFQLSTYNWNWAPYLKELKKRIESNIYPPPAFYMGLVRGRTFLRFKILPDGSMTEFELITYTGHESLMNTSVHAIKASVPFLPLPSDFPEDHLGITVGFFYNEFIQ